MIDDKISCRQSLKRKGDFLEKIHMKDALLHVNTLLWKRKYMYFTFEFQFLLLLERGLCWQMLIQKILCLEQTFFEIVLEAFCKLTKDCSISALLELEKKSFSERFRMYCILLIHLGAFILGIIFDVMLLLDTSYTRALALY